MIDKMLQTRKEYVDLIRRELLGPGSEISIPDEEHELISSAPDGRYSLGILFPRDTKMNAENNDTVRSNSSEDAPEEDDVEEEAADTVANREEHGVMDVSRDEESSQDEEDNLDEEISLSAQNMPSSAGITFLAVGDTERITCDVSFGTYHSALPKECMVPFKAEHPEQVQVPASLRQYVKYDVEAQCFRVIDGNLSRKIIGASKRSDTTPENEEHDVYDAMYRLYDQLIRGHVRDPHRAEITLDFSNGEYNDGEGDGIDGIPVKLTGLRRNWRDNIWSITIMLVNDSKKPLRGQKKNNSLQNTHPAIFQPEIRISTDKNSFRFLPFSGMEDTRILDEEEKSLELQYRHKKNWANWLGTAANWSV
ncbi:MAG: helicase, partial [Clostridia bacterium]|nr:helicase [Clostridia bacterium]